jgi:class 3 adenylate cyclase
MVLEYIERRLPAILSADVVGYSRLTGADEEGTLHRLREFRAELIDPTIQAHHGRIIKTMGDSILVEFASVVDAVRSALEVQRRVAARCADAKPESRIEFRMGIHLGDVMMQADGDLLGDSVNIAARLEAIAEHGGICISEDAYRQVRDRLNEEFVDLGNKQLKNIARPMRVYSVKTGSSSLTRLKGSGSAKLRTPRRNRDDNDAARSGPTKLTTQVCVSAPGLRLRIETTEQATNLIDRNLPPELASLPRWTFARALLVEATRTGKSRDVNAASRQFTQALRNERWVDESRSRGSVRNK